MSSNLTIRKRIDSTSFTKMIDTDKNREDRRRFSKVLSLVNSVSVCLLNVLDILLLIIIMPYIFWQCASANDRVKIVFRAIMEVTLELLMWVIFAGVSILMTTTFLLEETYLIAGRNNTEKVQHQVNTRNDSGDNCRASDSCDYSSEPEEPSSVSD
ncbi:uncharacterized protein LOC143212315 [Lasioglossum baleicum]|uniref:uncharacterized protein LOC143212315 n=1 Tax=Lasioglossum baleicum TaxID=434251 RepID=UPI003FCE922E